MRTADLESLLRKVAAGECSVEAAVESLQRLPYDDLGFARLDHHRGLRTGIPEVVFGQGKTAEQVAAIVDRFVAFAGRAIVTRISREARDLVCAAHPQARYFELPRILAVGDFPAPDSETFVSVASGGTADMPIAEEAAVTIELLGTRVERAYDVGVAGIHRLFERLDVLRKAAAIVAVAGMEGALPTVLGGLVACPVIAVPTSVGYGANLGGISALLTMLNSCVPGVVVVNIDNGFGGGVVAHMIAKRAAPVRG